MEVILVAFVDDPGREIVRWLRETLRGTLAGPSVAVAVKALAVFCGSERCLHT